MSATLTAAAHTHATLCVLKTKKHENDPVEEMIFFSESQHQIFVRLIVDDFFNRQFGGWRRQGQCTFRIGRPRQRIHRFRFRFRGRPFVLRLPCRPLSVFVFRVTFGAVDCRVVRMWWRMWWTRDRSPIYQIILCKS